MKPATKDWIVRPGRDPEREARSLRARFQAITIPLERAEKRRRYVRGLARGAAIGLAGFGLAMASLKLSPWPAADTLKHIAAFPNCDAARSVGLAPAHKGEPGYYSRHDRDDDGIACEAMRSERSAAGARSGDPRKPVRGERRAKPG